MLDPWFRPVPAYRQASFRVVLAATTLVGFLPHLATWLRYSLAGSFQPFAWPGVPVLPWAVAKGLLGVGAVACLALFIGYRTRWAAGYLVVLGGYAFLLGHFAHNMHYHLLLLLVVAVSGESLTLRRLVARDRARATCAAWPEYLARWQLAIVLFHSGLDKLFNPLWGQAGTRLTELSLETQLPVFRRVHQEAMGMVRAWPGLWSVATIATELALAVAATVRRGWPFVIFVGAGFAFAVEFLVRPYLFPWDVLTTLILFLPAADRAYEIRFDAACPTCRTQRRVIEALDWMRRIKWSDVRAGSGEAELVGPDGIRYRGPRALGRLLLLMPGPMLIVFALLRFGGSFVGQHLSGVPWAPVVFAALLVVLALQLPGVDRGPSAWLFKRLSTVGNRLLLAALGDVPVDPAASEAHLGAGPTRLCGSHSD